MLICPSVAPWTVCRERVQGGGIKLVHGTEGLVVWDLFSALPQERAEAAKGLGRRLGLETGRPGFKCQLGLSPAVESLVGHLASVQ